MANFNSNNLLGNQRRRNFIYNPVASRSRDSSSFGAQPGSSASVVHAQQVVRAPVGKESPYKKFKSSHGLPDKRADEIAAEEACRDLPPDAFDDEEFYRLDDDFDDDDLLTAEQLEECDRLASSNLHQQNQQLSVSSRNVTSSSHVGPEKRSDENDDVKETQEYVASASSRELRAPILTHPQESVNYVKPLGKNDSLLNSFVDQYNGTVSMHNSDVSGNSVGKIGRSNCLEANLPESGQLRQMESLRKEIERLKTEFAAANTTVKKLEEDKFSKDGEIKILRDSLAHFHAEEKKRQAEKKAADEKQAREQSQREKELVKQVENLTTQICFKEREISQMIEQNKKRTASLTEGSNINSPKRKTVNLSEVFPTGTSFFLKTSPETKVKSPRLKGSSKDTKTRSKQDSPRLSEADNSENSALSGTSNGSSSMERMKTQRRDNDANEKYIVQLLTESFPEVELVQNLLSPREKEVQQDNSGSIISLLTTNTCSMQKTSLNETDVSHTLRLFDTQAASKMQRSISSVTQKDSSINYDNTSVMQTLSGLLNYHQVGNNNVGKDKCFNSKIKDCHLPTAVKFLPLLESHIAHYVQQRTETSDDTIISTCLPRSSPTNDSTQSRDSSGLECEHTKSLVASQRTALISLRLLNILVLHSCEVCECILKSARVYGNSNEDDDDRVIDTNNERAKIFSSKEADEGFTQHPLFSSVKIAIRKSSDDSSHISSSGKLMLEPTTVRGRSDSEEVIHQTELLAYLFRLLMPQPKDSLNVVYATLQVLTSLTRNCEVQFLPRMLPLLSDNLLSQCLSKDWTLSTLSLVTSLLTPLTRHSCFQKKLCSQSDDCILLKIYQGWLFKPADVPESFYQEVHLKICALVNNLLTTSDSSVLLFPVESECHCSLELIKCLVLMLDRELISLSQVPCESLMKHPQNSHSLMLLRQGVFLLSTLCLNDRLFVEHRVEVEHQYVNVVSRVTRLYKQIACVISEAEVLAVQELVDFEHIEGIEWSQESEDEEDETVEAMDVAE